MKIFCKNTSIGLIPLYPGDLTEKRKLKLGHDYECEIKNPRNPEFHRKFFSLMRVGYDNTQLDLPFDSYRRLMTSRAGYFNAYATDKGTYFEAQSISFSNMSQDEFEELYSRCIDVIIKDIGSDRKEIEKIIEFM